MSGPLDGLAVIVTRPEHQAAPFLRMLRDSGAVAVAFPTLAIEPVTLDPETRARLAHDDHDWVVYTSVNAVEHGCSQLPRLRRARIAVVGPATARALAARGLAVDAMPEATHDSEGLLALPGLAQLRGRRVLILRGVGGRETLRQTLMERGADVDVVEIYRRVAAIPAAAAVAAVEQALAGERTVVAVTSVDVLDGLLALAPEPLQAGLRATRLLVPGERVARAARERGWRTGLIVARSAADGEMLAALLDWRRTEGVGTLA